MRAVAQSSPDALMFPGHEYTVQNHEFGLRVLPGDAALARRLAASVELRADKTPTVPVRVADEVTTNVFLRSHEDLVHRRAKAIMDEKQWEDLPEWESYDEETRTLARLRLIKDKGF